MTEMKDYSYVFNAHPNFIDNMYQQYMNDPQSVEEGWRVFFDGFEFASKQSDSEIEQGAPALSSSKEFSVTLSSKDLGIGGIYYLQLTQLGKEEIENLI